MKTLRENKVVNPVGPWEGTAMQSWARFHLLQLFYQDGSEGHHIISKYFKCGMHRMERLPRGKEEGWLSTK
eukprot:6080052-Prorocentrum_lima.AAC.1